MPKTGLVGCCCDDVTVNVDAVTVTHQYQAIPCLDGGATPFLRIYEIENGIPINTYDYDVDGNPYTVTGAVTFV